MKVPGRVFSSHQGVGVGVRVPILGAQGGEGHGGRVVAGPVAPAHIAQDALEGVAHLLVAVRVDDGVDQRVTLCQHQEVLLIQQDFAALAVHPVQNEDNQPRGPADHKGT